jgi:hypothetical protein
VSVARVTPLLRTLFRVASCRCRRHRAEGKLKVTNHIIIEAIMEEDLGNDMG